MKSLWLATLLGVCIPGMAQTQIAIKPTPRGQIQTHGVRTVVQIPNANHGIDTFEETPLGSGHFTKTQSTQGSTPIGGSVGQGDATAAARSQSKGLGLGCW